MRELFCCDAALSPPFSYADCAAARWKTYPTLNAKLSYGISFANRAWPVEGENLVKALEKHHKVDAGGISFIVRLVPGAKKEAFLGVVDLSSGTALKISVHAKPVDNQANEALVEFLAEALGIARSDIAITRGHKSREKQIFIAGIDNLLAGR